MSSNKPKMTLEEKRIAAENKKNLLFCSANRMYKIPKHLPTGPLETVVERAAFPSACPKCSSKEIVSDGRRIIEFVSLNDNGEFIIRHWNRPRIKCKKCNKSSWPIGFDVKKQKELDNITYHKILDNVLSNPTLKMADFEIKGQSKETNKEISIKKTTIDNLLKAKMKAEANSIEYIPCSALYYMSYKCKRVSKNNPNEICALIGRNEKDGPMYLLALLPKYTKKEISQLHTNQSLVDNRPQISLCALNSEVIKHIKEYRDVEPGILLHYITNNIDAIRDKHNGPRTKYYNSHKEEIDKLRKDGVDKKEIIKQFPTLKDFPSYSLLNNLKAILINKKHLNISEYHNSLKNWENNWEKHLQYEENEEIGDEVKPLFKKIIQYYPNCHKGTPYGWTVEFSMLADLIFQYSRTNIKFDTLQFRLLYANRIFVNQFETHKMFTIADNTPFPIKNFGINIRELYDEYYARTNFIDYVTHETDILKLKSLGIEVDTVTYSNNKISYTLPDYLQNEIDKLEALLTNPQENRLEIQKLKMNLSSGIFAAENNLLISSECAKHLKEKYNL